MPSLLRVGRARLILDSDMPPILHPPVAAPVLWPLAVGRPLGSLFVAGTDFASLQAGAWAGTEGVHLAANAWVHPDDAAALVAAGKPARLVDAHGRVLAWLGTADDGPQVAASSRSLLVGLPWDLLRVQEIVMQEMESPAIAGELSPAAHVEGVLVLGEGSRVLPGVFLEGNILIGRNCKIGPNCYLRGSTAIADGCHIGQAVEVKNSIIGRGTSVGHLSYLGDSIVGDGVNLGAGTITSNFRHDGANHRSLVDGRLVDTGRRKFGAVIGDGVHTGIHTSIYPGRKLGPAAATRPGEIVSTDR